MHTILKTALLLLLGLIIIVTPVLAAEAPLKVFYAGPAGSVRTALELAKFQFVTNPASADLLVLNETIPDARAAADLLRKGTGMLLILGPGVSSQDLQVLTGFPLQMKALNEPVSLKAESAPNGILKDIYWNTAPQARERYDVRGTGEDTAAGLEALVSSYDSGETLFASQAIGQGQLYLVTARLDGDNAQLREWGYYNYLIYNLAERAAGRQPLSFGDYPASPVPHPDQQIVLYIALAGMVALSALAFLFVRRYSRAHPDLLDTLVRDRQAFRAREAGTDWEQIGFHRPLGGFMFALMNGLFLFIPLTVYQDMILPVYILPSAQALGIYGRVAAFFPIIWSLFDMGTSVAHMKFFSEYRVRDPRRAIQYAQFFVWWQALTGAAQVALVVGFAGTYMPKSAYALYTWAVITHTMIQIPGFYRIFTDAFSGIQRSDYGTILDMGINIVFPMVAQPVIISLMVWWSQSHPIFGPAMSGVMGLGLAAYAVELMSFGFGWYLYRRLGYNSRLLLMAHFSKDVVLESLKYGIFLFLSGLIGGLGSSLNVLFIQNRLFNNNEVLGNLGMANSFVFAFTVFQSLTGAMMPSISEAISNGRRILAQYYAANGYKYGAMVSGFICAIMLAVADRFILGSSGPTFARAAVFVIPALFAGAMNFAAWNAECIMYGAGKTRLTTVVSLLDLFLSVGLSYLLVDRFQVFGLLAVPFVTTPIRIAFGYFLNHRYCFPQKLYFWQTLAAPVLAGGVHYLVLRALTGLIWQKDEITSILILVVALIPSYPLYALLYGFFGGWDRNTLEVFDRGTKLTSFMRPFTRLFFNATALGARVSPLHNRFPFTNHDLAMAEARTLTEERVSLVQPQAPEAL
jgi:O-antigen/teichoic acid export membrane protein